MTLADAEASARTSVAECLEAARSPDLFGGRRGLDRSGLARLAELRRELRQVRALRRALARERQVPWFDYRVQFADVFAAGGFDLVAGQSSLASSGGVVRRSCAAAWRAGIAGGALVERATPTDRTSRSPFSSAPSSSRGPAEWSRCWPPRRSPRRDTAPPYATHWPRARTLIAVADLTTDPRASFEATVYPLALVIRNSSAPPRHRVRIALKQGPTVMQSSLRGGRTLGAAARAAPGRAAPSCAESIRRSTRSCPVTSDSRPAPTGCS